MRIRKYQNEGVIQRKDGTIVDRPFIPNLPVDDSNTSTILRNYMLRKRAKTNQQKDKEELHRKAHLTGSVAPYNEEAHNGWMELAPVTGDPTWHSPTIVSAEPLSEGLRMWQSPAFLLALAPMLDIPMLLKGPKVRIVNNVPKPWKTDPSKINSTTRFYILDAEDKGYFELVKDIEPNLYSVHFKPVNANNPHAFSDAEKTLLFQSIADEIPVGSNLSTWGTLTRGGVHGLNRFSNLGFTLTGTRAAHMKSGEPIEIPIFTKLPGAVKKPYTAPNVSITAIEEPIGTNDPQFLGYMDNILSSGIVNNSLEARFGTPLFSRGFSPYVFLDANNPNLILKILSGKYNTWDELQTAIDKELMSIKGLPLQEPFNVEGYIVNQGKLTPVFSLTNLQSLNLLPVEEFNKLYGLLIADKLAPYGYKAVSGPGEPLIFSNGKSRLTSFVPQNAGLNSDGELRFFDVMRDNIVDPSHDIINWLMQLKSTDPLQYEIMSLTLGIKIPDIF